MSARPGLADRVVRQLITAVEDGRYPVGSRLPPEAVLAEAADVSRLTLREAVRVLRDKGVLRVEQGRGTFVNLPSRWSALDPALLSSRAIMEGDPARTAWQITETRSLVEVGAAGLAAERRSEEDIVALRGSLEGMRQTVYLKDVGDFSQADVDFHDAVMRAAGNPFLAALMEPVKALVRQVRARTSLALDMRVTAIDAHASILDAIAAGDPESARQTMSAHMNQTHRVIDRLVASGALPLQPTAGPPQDKERRTS